MPHQPRAICILLFLAATAALLVASPLTAQSLTPSTSVDRRPLRNVRYMKSNQASKRDMGSADVLAGKVAICHVFCFDNESYWQPAEKDRALQLVQQALEFIQQESRRHNQVVQFVQRSIGPVKIERTITTSATASPAWTEEVIDQASGHNAKELVKRLKNELAADSVLVCLHVNKSALSYNLAYYDNVNSKFGAERMVCFLRYPDGRETAAATYAHEILHLFGAGDLYFPYDTTPARKLRAAKLFPNDVMYRVDYDVQDLNVGPFTAFRVGWTDQLDTQLRMFEDR